MKTNAVPGAWLARDRRRLDCGPYMSGALEAKVLLETLSCRKDRLADLTTGHAGGIYNGPQFVRNFVDDPAYGVPFLGTASMLNADLSRLPLLRKRDAYSAKLAYLRVEPGMTLISCSGSIGRMVYARPDMDGMWSNQDIMKVVSDPEKIPAGYLYAYLSSKFGVPLVVSGTYGAIIQHIEPEHIADLPVPRLGPDFECLIDALIQIAADSRDRSSKLKDSGRDRLTQDFGLSDLRRAGTSVTFATFSAPKRALSRLDAAHFSPECVEASRELASGGPRQTKLRKVARVFTPGIFKRIHVESEDHGYPYFSGTELFQVDPPSRGYLSKRSPNISDYVVNNGWLLIQDAGQLGGLIGHLIRVGPNVANGVVSNHLMRIVPEDPEAGAYIYAVLSSAHGYRAITRQAFGTSIPQLDPKHIGDLDIPWPKPEQRARIAQPILQAWDLEDSAIDAERKAVRLVEQAIEDAA